jgi:primosomal protein N' (replication factor Y)
VVRVVAGVTGIAKAFDYLVPEELSEQVQVGTEVTVHLGRRRVRGWVVEDGTSPPAGVELRALVAVRGVGPPAPVVELCRWASWRWAGPLPRLLQSASPPASVRALPAPGAGRLGPRRAQPSGGGAPGAEAALELAGEALAGGVCVARLAPAHDPFPLVEAAADRAEAPGAGVLVLVPGRRQAEALAERLRRQGRPVALVPDQWALARAGGVVAVGTRGAALAPLPGLSAAVVLDAHDQAYHEERTPTWVAWEVVAERARREGAPCALVSACPTLALLAAGRLLTGSRRAERAGWPLVEVVDRRGEDPRTGLYSPALVDLVRWAAAGGGRRVLCVANRRGRARLLACAACGGLARCERCGAALGQGAETELSCPRCGWGRPALCSACGSSRLKRLRLGVSALRDELEALAGTPVAEVSSGTPEAAHPGPDPREAAVVVGTEALLHRAGWADAVAFVDLDSELLAPRMGAAEQAMALVARAARLVGAGRDPRPSGAPRAPGRLVLQTRLPEHPVVRAVTLADPGLVPAAEAPVRAALRLPPVTALALVSGAAADAYGAALAAAAGEGVEVLGPHEHTWTVRAEDHRRLADLLASVPRPPGRLRVEVDPVRA